MSKQDYVRIAAEFAAMKSSEYDYGGNRISFIVAEGMRSRLAHGIARVLQTDNPNFDRARFLKACEVEE